MMEAGSNNKLDKGEIVEYEADPLEIIHYETDPLALGVPNKVIFQSEVFNNEIRCEDFSYDEGSDDRLNKCDERMNKCEDFSYDKNSDERFKREIDKYENYEDIVKDEHEVIIESDGVSKRVKVGNSDGDMLVHVEITKSSRNKNGNSSSAEGNTPRSVITPAKMVQLQCHQCRKVVYSKAAVVPVVRLGVKKYVCLPCAKQNWELNSIIKQLHQCEVCEKVFANQQALTHHSCTDIPRPVPVPDNACNECDQMFLYKRDLNQHYVKDHHRFKYKCSYCPEGFHYKIHLNQHLASVHFRDRYKCDKCGEGFCYQKDLKHHSGTMHEADIKHMCNQCSKIFSSKKLFLAHLVTKHASSNKHKCDDCCELFSSKRQLSVHQGAVHSKDTNINN